MLEDAAGPLSAPEVLEAAQRVVPAMGIATVYRNLKSLTDEGWLAGVELPGQPARYERAGQDHHHHFHCDACGRVYDVGGCSAEIERRLPHGFRARRHELLLYGLCADCA